MLTYNDWLQTNVYWLPVTLKEQFEVKMYPYPFYTWDNYKATATYNAYLIYFEHKEDFFLGLSGGADSEYIARLFTELKIPFTPVIISFPGNAEDTDAAITLCSELKLEPIIVQYSEKEIFDYYKEICYTICASDGLTHTMQMLVVEEAKRRKGIAILGESHIFDPNPRRCVVRAFKFIPDFIYDKVIPFYYYTLSIVWAEMNEVREHETSQGFKARVRGTKRRDKTFPVFSVNTSWHYADCLANLGDLKRLRHDMGTPQDFINRMREYAKE